MTTAILVPYTILEFCFLGYNLVTGWPWTRAPDVYGTRNSGFFDIAVAFRYTEAHWLALNVSWVPVVSVAVICLWYSTSAEAVNTYREYLLAVGLGCVWPRLREPFTLDTRASSRPWNSVHSEKMGTRYDILFFLVAPLRETSGDWFSGITATPRANGT